MLITILCVMMLEKKSFIQTVRPIIKEKAHTHLHTYILNKL